MGGVVAEICAESEGGAVEKIRKDVTVGIESDHRIGDGDTSLRGGRLRKKKKKAV